MAFGDSRDDDLSRHDHTFRKIEPPRRIVLDTTEIRADGSTVVFETEFVFEERESKTLMTMIQRGLPTAELREEHRGGLPNAFTRFAQVSTDGVRS